MALFKKYIDYDLELEEKVIGVFLIEPNSYSQMYGILSEGCFYGNKTKRIFNAIKETFDLGYGIDYLTVQRYFFDKKIVNIDGENIPYIISNIMYGVYSSAHLQIWCIKLRELLAHRLMMELRSGVSSNGDVFDDAADIEQQLKDILSVRVSDDWVHISQVGIKLSKHMDDMKGRMPGISTSIPTLDAINGGFRPGQLIVIGARPRVGKSAFMGRIAVRAAAQNHHVGIISLEMDDKDIMARSVSAESDVDFWNIDRNSFDTRYEDQQRTKVYETISNLSALPIHFSDSSQVNIHDIRAKAEKLKARGQLDLLIIDYLQLIESENTAKNTIREQEIAKMSRGLKLLAKNLQIPVIILAQLNRGSEAKVDKKPELFNLRESGAIEQDADVVLLLHRDFISGITTNDVGESTEGYADLLNKKWRNGREVDIKLGFHGPTMKFYDLNEPKPQSINTYMPDNPRAGFQNTPYPPLRKEDKDAPF